MKLLSIFFNSNVGHKVTHIALFMMLYYIFGMERFIPLAFGLISGELVVIYNNKYKTDREKKCILTRFQDFWYKHMYAYDITETMIDKFIEEDKNGR